MMNNKLFNDLLNLHYDNLEIVGNNYEITTLKVMFYIDCVEITSICITDDRYWNNDLSIIRWEDINPNRLYNFLRNYAETSEDTYLFVSEE